MLCCAARTTAIFKVNYQSHLAMRVLLPLRSFEVREKMDLYEQVPVACVYLHALLHNTTIVADVRVSCHAMHVCACRVVCAHTK